MTIRKNYKEIEQKYINKIKLAEIEFRKYYESLHDEYLKLSLQTR